MRRCLSRPSPRLQWDASAYVAHKTAFQGTNLARAHAHTQTHRRQPFPTPPALHKARFLKVTSTTVAVDRRRRWRRGWQRQTLCSTWAVAMGRTRDAWCRRMRAFPRTHPSPLLTCADAQKHACTHAHTRARLCTHTRTQTTRSLSLLVPNLRLSLWGQLVAPLGWISRLI